MKYLTVLNAGSKYFLLLNKEDNGIATINAVDTLDEAISPFEGFKDKIKGNYESYASATIGLLAINPSFIGWDKPAEEIAQFVLRGDIVRLTGGTILGLHKSIFVEVDKKILEYEVKTLFMEVIEALETN